MNGSVGFIAGEALSFTVNAGLFDITVTTGSDNPTPINHSGNTGGPASTGSGDDQRIYMVAVPKNQAITMLLSQSTSCAAAMSQVAAVTALEGPQQCVADARQLFERRRNRMAELLNGIRGIRCFAPDGAFYVFASVAGLFGATTPAGR